MVRLNPDEHGTMCGCHVQTFSTETNHFYSLLGKFHSMNQGYKPSCLSTNSHDQYHTYINRSHPDFVCLGLAYNLSIWVEYGSYPDTCTIISTEISPVMFGSLVSYSSLWLLNDLVLAVFSSLLLVGCPCDIVPLNLGMTSFEVIVAIMASTFLLIFVLIILS